MPLAYEQLGRRLRRIGVVEPDATVGDGGQITIDQHQRRRGRRSAAAPPPHARDVRHDGFASLVDEKIEAAFSSSA